MTTQDDLNELLKQGEGPTVEFKRSDILSQSEELAKLMVAFTNTMGGKLLIGVLDDGKIEGMSGKKEHEEHIINIARDKIDPPLFVEFESVKIGGYDVYIVNIARFSEVPHALKARSHHLYFIRVGTTVREPSPLELKQIFSGTFMQIPKEKIESPQKKGNFTWEVKYPKQIPNPFENDNISKGFNFPVDFKLQNLINEPINFKVYIVSENNVIVFVHTKPRKVWIRSPYPHREIRNIFLNDLVIIEVPGHGSASQFTFQGLYRPRFAYQFYPGRLVLTFQIRGSSFSGKNFEVGPQRLEIPFAQRKKETTKKSL